MNLTPKKLCELYARISNLEEPPDELCDLIHIEAEWVTKWWTKRYSDIQDALLSTTLSSLRSGLRHVKLVSGHRSDDGSYAHCTVSVPLSTPDKHDSRTYFQTDGRWVTHIFSYAEWMNRTWPHPLRVEDKINELLSKDIPINAIARQPMDPDLFWPDDGRNPPDTNPRDNPTLQRVREVMAEVLDADPEGAEIPDLGLE